MLKFNDNNIVVGIIKEMLADFNLPKLRVYTKENEDYFTAHGEEKNIIETIGSGEHVRYISYIKDNILQQYIDGSWTTENSNETYAFNKQITNLTKNLKITNNIYDYYTHEYLGNYLRFLRDYLNFDLMMLYNCFSNRICNSLNFSFTNNSNTITFNAKDAHYKIYMLPVKLFKDYTIAIDSKQPIELCCGIYGKRQDKREKFESLPSITYMKINRTQFNNQFLYTKLNEITGLLSPENEMELAQSEDDLKLFIKLPANNISAVTVLEGNYLNWNNKSLYPKIKSNNFIVNFEGPVENDKHIGHQEDQYFRPITELQLLQVNSGTSYPIADRLIEYLTGQAITELDENADNIRRVQKVFTENKNTVKYSGFWESKIRHALYTYMNANLKKDVKTASHDCLGYVDKDVEKYYKSVHIVTDNDVSAGRYPGKKAGDEITLNTLNDVDIYEDELLGGN